MTPDHIRDALHIATTTDYKTSDLGVQSVNQELFARLIQYKVLEEVLVICRANLALSDSAMELFKDLKAYDRYERGFNY